MTASSVLDVLEEIISSVVDPAAADVDAAAEFPRAAVTALGERGVLGLMSSADVGGLGGSLGDAAQVVRRLVVVWQHGDGGVHALLREELGDVGG